MKTLDRKMLQKFIRLAGEELAGEWVLIGGTVLPLLGVEHRVTTDIDFIEWNAATSSGSAQTLKLMELAAKLGLPVESINQAGAFFLAKQKISKSSLILLHEGTSAVIYRPDVTLYLRLKIARLTESDLQDCAEFLRFAKKNKEPCGSIELMRLIRRELGKSKSAERSKRLGILTQLLK